MIFRTTLCLCEWVKTIIVYSIAWASRQPAPPAAVPPAAHCRTRLPCVCICDGACGLRLCFPCPRSLEAFSLWLDWPLVRHGAAWPVPGLVGCYQGPALAVRRWSAAGRAVCCSLCWGRWLGGGHMMCMCKFLALVAGLVLCFACPRPGYVLRDVSPLLLLLLL